MSTECIVHISIKLMKNILRFVITIWDWDMIVDNNRMLMKSKRNFMGAYADLKLQSTTESKVLKVNMVEGDDIAANT